MTPTAEQKVCLERFQTGRKLKIGAYAGTGKTSTLSLLAKGTRRTGTYLAFNRSIATEAGKKFPNTIACSTQHALAFRAMVKDYDAKKMTGSVNGGYLAARLNLQRLRINKDVSLTERGMGWLIGATVKRWCGSGDNDIGSHHMPVEGKLVTLSPGELALLREQVVRAALNLWTMMEDPKSDMPMGHDGYLKLWALGKPSIAGDFILLDEAQDTNGVILELMRHQSAQLICVGDRHQQIYEWRGARNAMVELPAELEARLSTSFRFGTAIAGYASGILELLGETVPLTGNPDKPGFVTNDAIVKPNAILCRNNGRLLEQLLASLERGERPAVVGGTTEVLNYVRAAESLMAGRSVDHPLDFFGFKDWSEVKVVSEFEDGAPELRRWVKLFEDHDIGRLRSALEGLPKDESSADVVFSTAHKSKGREWSLVRLSDDLLQGVKVEKDSEKPDGGLRRMLGADKAPLLPPMPEDHAAELRLLYVACTRGERQLEVPPLLAEKLAQLTGRPRPKLATVPDSAIAVPVGVPVGVGVVPNGAMAAKVKRNKKRVKELREYLRELVLPELEVRLRDDPDELARVRSVIAKADETLAKLGDDVLARM